MAVLQYRQFCILPAVPTTAFNAPGQLKSFPESLPAEKLGQKSRKPTPPSPELPYYACASLGGGALARGIVVIVVSPYPWRPQSRDAAAPQPHPAVSLRGRRGACEPGAAFRPVSCFSLGRGRKPEQPGAELRAERTPTRPTCSFASVRCARAGSPRGGRRWRWRKAAAAAAVEERSPRLPRRQRNGGDSSGHPAAHHQAAESE